MKTRGRYLVIDWGNTRIKSGVFDDGKLLTSNVWEALEKENILDVATNHRVENVILSSVSRLPSEAVLDFLRKNFFFVYLDHTTPLPITNAYQTPETLGKDRLAAAVGAWQNFPRQNSLVVDAGTCITLDVVEASGKYVGGNISPGLRMRMKAMHEFTANLPLVEPGPTEYWLGKNTSSALINGAQEGFVLELDGYLQRCESVYPSINVILTGGDADFLAKKMKKKIFVNQNLVLEGLNKILDYNVKQLD